MPVALTGIYNAPLQKIKDLLAASTTFQALVSAEDADDAMGFIYHYDLEDVDSYPDYFLLVDHSNKWTRSRKQDGQVMTTDGTLWICFDFITPAELVNDFQGAMANHMNVVGAIMKEVEDAAEWSIRMRGNKPVYGPVKSLAGRDRDCVMCVIEVDAS